MTVPYINHQTPQKHIEKPRGVFDQSQSVFTAAFAFLIRALIASTEHSRIAVHLDEKSFYQSKFLLNHFSENLKTFQEIGGNNVVAWVSNANQLQ